MTPSNDSLTQVLMGRMNSGQGAAPSGGASMTPPAAGGTVGAMMGKPTMPPSAMFGNTIPGNPGSLTSALMNKGQQGNAMKNPMGTQQPMPTGAAGAMAPTGLPSSPTRTPPAWQRFITGQKMQEAYRNNWQPNPMLVRMGATDPQSGPEGAQ